MEFRYTVIGTRRQERGFAYNLALYGQSSEIIKIDLGENVALSSASRVNRSIRQPIVKALKKDTSFQFSFGGHP